MSVTCRKAKIEDIEPLFGIIQGYADQAIMLPRSREALMQQLDTFAIAEWKGEVVGCGSLTKLGRELVEIRSLGVVEGYKGLGIGSKLVDFLLHEAKQQKIPKVMALTYEVPFFLKKGFKVVEKDIFPEKVWTDCIYCPKRHACDEISVLKEIDVS